MPYLRKSIWRAQFSIELFSPLMQIDKIVNYCSAGVVGPLMVRPCPVVLGLGAVAYEKLVKFNDQVEAIRSEHVLILLTQQAFVGKSSPIRLSDPQYLETKLPDYPTVFCPALKRDP